LHWKRELHKFNVAVWRHKQRTPSNNDHHTPMLKKPTLFRRELQFCKTLKLWSRAWSILIN